MEKVMLDDVGRLPLPDKFLKAVNWKKGMEFIVKYTPRGILVLPAPLFPVTQLESPDAPSVYKGKPLTLEEMDAAIEAEAGKHK